MFSLALDHVFTEVWSVNIKAYMPRKQDTVRRIILSLCICEVVQAGLCIGIASHE